MSSPSAQTLLDLAADVRMMVPLFRDIQRDEFHVLAVVGYEQRELLASFVERVVGLVP